MRLVPCSLLLLVGFAASASDADATGNWHLDNVAGIAPQTAGDAEFEFKVEGKKLTGTAHVGVGGWPADGPIHGGAVNGDHIAFSVHGKVLSSGGFPEMKFTGTVHGDEMELTMTFFYRGHESDSVQSEFKGKRVK